MRNSIYKKWINIVQNVFGEAPPNGWLLGWDDKRYFESIAKQCEPHKTTNVTSFDYSFCNKYEIKIRGIEDDSSYLVLTVRISFIVDAYSIHWTRYKQDGRFGVVVSTPKEKKISIFEDNMHIFFQKKGYSEILDEWYEKKVSGVQLELSSKSDVILGKCLFEDYE